ncbi:hypothetical protein L596_021878 [Steinernema carpocapsae]|uniref:Uncharacterized protein n=1 Tax=Steinernema carpocapsae TaxID=34508 RepID=A0A4U5MK36_STECR|nr:hypothetical protein L596_021878 [Steinernema carpocapsae]
MKIVSFLFSLDAPEEVRTSWPFTILVVACALNFWMLYMTRHVYEYQTEQRANGSYDDYDSEYNREDSSYGNRVDDFYANALDELYDQFGI